MDWTRPDFLINGGLMWCGDRFLGSFSSHQAAMEGLQLQRKQLRPMKCRSLTEDDFLLLELIDEEP